jgi:hypothetical protein
MNSKYLIISLLVILSILIFIYTIYLNNSPEYLDDSADYISDEQYPTFHILIATYGRASMINLLDSLRDQLTKNDAITIVFDGPDAYTRSNFDKSWLDGHESQINIIVNDVNLGYWGHPIREKYVQLIKPETTFIMHADDDDSYYPNSFNKLRKLCKSSNTLYISKMNYANDPLKVIPSQNKQILLSDIGTPNGIIPFNMARFGHWENKMGGDFEYYNSLQKYINNIVFLDEIIYKVR